MDQDVPPRPTAYCLFPCRSSRLAVSLDAVEGIIEAARLVRLPMCPPPVSGLCTYRGGFVPVVRPADDGEDQGAGHAGRWPTVLVLRTGHGHLGLMIDREGIAIVDADEVSRSKDARARSTPGPPLATGFVVAGSVDREGTSYAIIDPGPTWLGLRSVIEPWYGACLGIETRAGPS